MTVRYQAALRTDVRLILLAFSTFAMLEVLTAAFFGNSVFRWLFNTVSYDAAKRLAAIGCSGEPFCLVAMRHIDEFVRLTFDSKYKKNVIQIGYAAFALQIITNMSLSVAKLTTTT